jgi:CRISPR-associated protein Cas1
MIELVLSPLKPIPIKDRISVAHVGKGNINVLDGAFVVVDKNGIQTPIPGKGNHQKIGTPLKII